MHLVHLYMESATSCDDSLVSGTASWPRIPAMRRASSAAEGEPKERVTVVCSPGAPLTLARVLEMIACCSSPHGARTDCRWRWARRSDACT